MKKEEARKIHSKISEEISYNEWYDLIDKGEYFVDCEHERLYFKPKEKFPLKFEGKMHKMVLYEDRKIHLRSKDYGDIIVLQDKKEKEALLKFLKKSLEMEDE